MPTSKEDEILANVHQRVVKEAFRQYHRSLVVSAIRHIRTCVIQHKHLSGNEGECAVFEALHENIAKGRSHLIAFSIFQLDLVLCEDALLRHGLMKESKKTAKIIHEAANDAFAKWPSLRV
jgi:hypothetical protein